MRLYRFQVDRVYKGILPETKELIINPDNFTDCRTEYEVGKQYLMFARPLPAEGSGVITYVAGECSGSRPLQQAVRDLVFLDDFVRGKSITRIFGNTLQSVSDFAGPRKDELAPAPGAKVEIFSGGKRWQQVTGPDGAYSFEGLIPGTYSIGATLVDFESPTRFQEIELTGGGCVEQFLELKSHTRVSGVVVNYRGHPARKVRVELLRRSSTGKWYSASEFWTYTSGTGRFAFKDIPTGEYLLGSEIRRGRPTLDSAVPTTYYPGVPEQVQASILGLAANQKLGNLTLRLRRPDTPRRIQVTVTWPDDSPPGRNLLQIIANGDLVRNIGGKVLGPNEFPTNPRYAGGSNTITFTGYEERDYRISARYWVDGLGGPVPEDQQRVADTNAILIGRGTGPATARLILGPPKLAEERAPPE